MAKVPFGRLVSVAAAARRLGKSRRQIVNYIHAELLAVCPVDGGRGYVLDGDVLDKFEPPKKTGRPKKSAKSS